MRIIIINYIHNNQFITLKKTCVIFQCNSIINSFLQEYHISRVIIIFPFKRACSLRNDKLNIKKSASIIVKGSHGEIEMSDKSATVDRKTYAHDGSLESRSEWWARVCIPSRIWPTGYSTRSTNRFRALRRRGPGTRTNDACSRTISWWSRRGCSRDARKLHKP